MTGKDLKRLDEIRIRMNRVNIIPQKGWERFVKEHLFFYIHISAELKNLVKKEEDSYIRPDLYGKPLGSSYRQLQEYDETIVADEKEKNEKENDSENKYASVQDQITDKLIILRTGGEHVSRVYKAGGRSLVMIPNSLRKNVEELFSGKNEYHIEFVEPTNRYDVTVSDIANLLLIEMQYITSESRGTAIPPDYIPSGYTVHLDGKAPVNIINGSHNAGKQIKNIKNAFCSLYIKEEILHMDLKPYYEYGDWFKSVKNEKIKNKISKRFRYMVYKNDNTWYLVQGKNGERLSRSFCTSRIKKFRLDVRSVDGKSSEKHERTKTVIADRMIFCFNQCFKGIVSLELEEWVCKTKADSLYGGTSYAREVRRQNMITVNNARYSLTYNGKADINVFLSESELSRTQETYIKNEVMNMCRDLLVYATYEASGFTLKENDHIFFSTDNLDVPVIEVSARYKKKGAKKGEEITESGIREKDGYSFIIPPNTEKIVFVLKLSRDIVLDDLQLTEILNYSINNGKMKSKEFEYKHGLGIDEEDVGLTYGNSYDPNKMNIHIVEDTEDPAYDGTKCLSVQHVTLYGKPASINKQSLNDNLKEIIRKSYFELALRSDLINHMIPLGENVGHDLKKALYVKHYPKNKQAHTKAFKRYFLYDADYEGNEDMIREIHEEEALARFPMIYPENYGDAYVIENSKGSYYISRTSIVPMGITELDENGELKPLKEIGSRSQSYADNYAGYVGISFKEEPTLKTLYYMVADARYLAAITQAGIMRFPNVYQIMTEDLSMITPLEMLGLVEDTRVRVNEYTVIPYIFKYIREWAEVAGRERI